MKIKRILSGLILVAILAIILILGNTTVVNISISIVAPLVEEMLFRYGLRKVTGKTKYFPLITAILFGGVHTLAGIGLSLKELLFILPYGSLGYAFGYLYNKSDNIISTIVSHSIHNTIVFIIILTVA